MEPSVRLLSVCFPHISAHFLKHPDTEQQSITFCSSRRQCSKGSAVRAFYLHLPLKKMCVRTGKMISVHSVRANVSSSNNLLRLQSFKSLLSRTRRGCQAGPTAGLETNPGRTPLPSILLSNIRNWHAVVFLSCTILCHWNQISFPLHCKV